TFLAQTGMSPQLGAVPSYDSPETAVAALAGAVAHAGWRQRPVGALPDLGDIDTDAALAVARGNVTGGRTALSDEQTNALLDAVEDPLFGAVVSVGVGGIATELLGDRAYRAVPLTDVDAAEMVRSLRAAALLLGWRGADAVDVAALEDLLLRVSVLLDELAEV